MVALFRAMLGDASFRLDINGQLSESMKLRVGLPQGNPISCLLFLLFIESLANYLDGAEAAEHQEACATAAAAGLPPPPPLASRGIPSAGQMIRDLFYADDLECHGSSFNELERARLLIEKWCAAWRMFTNASPGKSEYVYFFRLLQRGAAGARQPPLQVPATCRPLQFPGLPDMNAVPGYRLLGVLLDMHLNQEEHFHAFASAQRKINFILHHKSHTLNMMGPGRQFQIVAIYSSSTYALPILTPTPSAMKDWTQFRAAVAARILRWPRANTSRLLLATLSGMPSSLARLLSARLRFFLQMRAHSHRCLLPSGRHASIPFWDALFAEYLAPGLPNAAPNWFRDLDALIASAPNPERPALSTLSVPWARLATPYMAPYIYGVTYFEQQRALAGDILPDHFVMGPAPPNLYGSKQAALHYTFGLSAPPSLFRAGARPIPFSIVGPGRLTPLVLAADKRATTVLRALLGASCLLHAPWTEPLATERRGKDLSASTEHEIPEEHPHGNEPRPCPFCNLADSLYHILGCLHRRMMAARAALVRDARLVFLPALLKALRLAIQRPADGLAPLVPNLSPAEDAALASLSFLDCDNELSNEAHQVLFRLALALPWPKATAQPGHHAAAALGALFDATISSNEDLRDLSALWANWADRSLTQLAAARRRAIADEKASPSLPPPPPWEGHVPVGAPPPTARRLQIGDLPLDLGPQHPMPVFAGPINGDFLLTKAWFKKCNTQALRHFVYLLQRTPAWMERVAVAGGAARGQRSKKPWHIKVLLQLGLRYRDFALMWPADAS